MKNNILESHCANKPLKTKKIKTLFTLHKISTTHNKLQQLTNYLASCLMDDTLHQNMRSMISFLQP
jgi:hypothetical protein